MISAEIKTDIEAMKKEVDSFLAANGFKHDITRPELGNIITSPLAHRIMGYDQMNYYAPIKAKGQN